jgi:P27 family predicted phage terminase small subunit
MAIKPPKHLTRESRKLWNQICDEYEMDSGALLLLLQACESLDRLREAQALLNTEGLVIVHPKTGNRQMNPAAKVEESARQALLRCWRQLKFEEPPPANVGRRKM